MPKRDEPAQTPEQIAAALESYLAAFPNAVVMEDGKVLFDMRFARYSLANEHGRCTIHLWGEEGNLVRRVVGTELRGSILRVSVMRFGQTRPQLLEFAGDKDRRTPSTREATRTRYVKSLTRVLERQFEHWKPEAFRTAMDLERSFGPSYARGLLVQGQKAWAVIGVNAEESPATIDGILTFGILWLQVCRESGGGRRLVQGLKVVVPRGMGTLTLARMAWLAGEGWELWEHDEREDALVERDRADQGNVHGLEFARVRARASQESFNRVEEITVGAGANESALTEENAAALAEKVAGLCARRRIGGEKRDVLYRMQPERWLEENVLKDVSRLDERLDKERVYPQVAAFAAHDRGMLDLLGVSEDGRLAVIELKAEEDPQLALQGLDYWIRVRWHHAQNPDRETGLGEFQQCGYFGGIRLSGLEPRLLLVAPALRVHPATEIVLRHFSGQIEWSLIALDERWREEIRVVWRKRSG